MSDRYQGHLSDGSSVQKHSAGGLYPYVVFGQQQGDAMRWGYIAPNGSTHLVADTYGGACDCALAHKQNAERLRAFRVGREFCLLACHIEVPPQIKPISNISRGDDRDEGHYTYADTLRQRTMADEMRRH